MALPSRELSEQALDSLIASERTRIVAPLTEWRTLATALQQEGIIRAPSQRETAYDAGFASPVPARRSAWRTIGRRSVQVAAGAALAGIGFVAGRASSVGQGLVNEIQYAIADSVSDHSISWSVGSPGFHSASDARRTLARSQADYQRAAAYLAASADSTLAPASSEEVYQGRLAALDEVSNASLNALKAMPADPLLSQYYLSTIVARDATLQQLGKSLPDGAEIVKF